MSNSATQKGENKAANHRDKMLQAATQIKAANSSAATNRSKSQQFKCCKSLRFKVKSNTAITFQAELQLIDAATNAATTQALVVLILQSKTAAPTNSATQKYSAKQNSSTQQHPTLQPPRTPHHFSRATPSANQIKKNTAHPRIRMLRKHSHAHNACM